MMLKKNKKEFFKLDNKGFAITSIIYSMLLLFIILMTLTILTLGRKKVLLDKTKNETLGLFSQLTNYPCIVTQKNAKGNTIGVGDVVTCKTENFYVVSNNGTNIEMLSKYNLNVGNNKILDDTEGIQSAKAIGSIKSEKNATLAFSSTNYWSASSSYPTFVYSNNSALYQYIENYATYLRNILELPELTASLIDYNKLMSLGCTQNSCTSAPSWVYLTSYWTGTAIDATHIKYVYNNGNTMSSSDTYSFSNNYGVRPLVTIPINKIRNDFINDEGEVIFEPGHKGVKAVVFFNPVLNKGCSESEAKSDTGTKTGCMKWYAYAETNTTYTMMLDHNTTAIIDNWNNRNTQLLTDTDGWNTSLNPRLITKSEIDSITEYNINTPYYFETKSNVEPTTYPTIADYAWLFDRTSSNCKVYGCLNNATGNNISNMSGYWTSSPSDSFAWNVLNSGPFNL